MEQNLLDTVVSILEGMNTVLSILEGMNTVVSILEGMNNSFTIVKELFIPSKICHNLMINHNYTVILIYQYIRNIFDRLTGMTVVVLLWHS